MGESLLVMRQVSSGNPETTFAFLHSPSGYSGAYKNTWSYQHSHGPAITTSSDGITVSESGYYYIEGAQRSDDNNNGYVGIGVNGNRDALEDRTSGVWTHDHSGRTDRFAHSKYIGYLNANEKITFGPPNSSGSNELRYGSQEHGFLFVLRLDMSQGSFSQDFGDYGWKDGPYSHGTTYQNNWEEEGHYGSSLNATSDVREIEVLKDGWYWIESAQRSDGGTAEAIIAVNGNISNLQNNNEILWVHDISTSTNTHAHGMCIAYLNAGDKITSGGTSSSGQRYWSTGWAGFLRAIRIDNQGAPLTSRNRVDAGWKSGPTSYVSDQLVNWSRASQYGTAISQNGRNLEIEESGHYYVEYCHRPNSSTDAYGTLSSNGNRSTWEDDNSGMWTHDHSSTSSNHYHSKWLGPNSPGDLFAAGPDQADSNYVRYGSVGYNGILFALRLK